MSRLTPILNFLGKTFHPFKVGKLYITPTYWQALVIVILLFFLVFTLARMRYLYVNWHLGRHSFAMFFWGFLLALIVEGFFIVGGRTLFTEILGMKNVPKPISTILDIGRSRLINVLGISDQIPSSSANQKLRSEDVYQLYNTLPPDEAQKLYQDICSPQ
jgi:hypothetical protein